MTQEVNIPREKTRRELLTAETQEVASPREKTHRDLLSHETPTEMTQSVLQTPEGLQANTTDGTYDSSSATSTPGSTPFRPKAGVLKKSELQKTEESMIRPPTQEENEEEERREKREEKREKREE